MAAVTTNAAALQGVKLNTSSLADTQVLTYDSASGTWMNKASASGFSNPMTTSGDIIYGGASGAPTRLAKGTDGQVLTLASGVPSWQAASGGGSSYPTSDSFHFCYIPWASDPHMSITGTPTIIDNSSLDISLNAQYQEVKVGYNIGGPAPRIGFWDKAFYGRLSMQLMPAKISGMNLFMRFGSGSYSTSYSSVKNTGFRYNSGTSILAVSCNGSAETTVDITTPFTAITSYWNSDYVVAHNPTVNDKHYINGSLAATITSSIASGDGDAQGSSFMFDIALPGVAVSKEARISSMEMWR